MKSFGLEPVPEYSCLFTDGKVIVFFYVDDICIFYYRKERVRYEEVRSLLLGKYEMREMGELKWFLGIRVVRDRTQRKIWLCQDSYIENMCRKFGVDTRGPFPKVPVDLTIKLRLYDKKATIY